ncbi:hypothetical protein QYE76_004274 [Lolium multiflorum]|uniref:F-box domain-containing protein n=1 Tax=Lolium multiflorum TaxID=4521 RepID=A0AAD8W189_LOLMU|nr:hypothetical protein QYE76_004274 [Lolium multiflorum]
MVSEETKPKKQRNEECIINCLPGDLIERIFLRLPVSTLLRVVGVCKQWFEIIRDPQFVSSHLQDAPNCALLFFPQESISGKPYPANAIVIDESWSQSSYAVPVIGPDDFLCGSCNGLLCLYTKTSTIKIANLATGEYLHLEKPVKNVRGDHFLFYSFGCHPLTKQYKITHFLGDCAEGLPRTHKNNRFSVIQVYTLGDEKWREIRTPEAQSLNCVKTSGAINVDGIMYWLTEDIAASWQHAVMTFDLNDENFARIELPAYVPEDCSYGGPRQYWVREIDGKLCIATAQTCRDRPRDILGKLQIWTLDNKAEQRWSQKYSIQSPDYIPGPNLVHGDKIMLQRRNCNLYSYELLGENLNTNLCKISKLLDFCPSKPGNMQSYICVKSLVRLDVYKKAGIVRRSKQREGWELKKWEAWEQEFSETEKMWSDTYQDEQNGTAYANRNGKALNALLPHILDDDIRQEIGMKINQIFPNFPDQQPRPLRRLNCMASKLDRENLISRMKIWNSITTATRQATGSIISMRSAVDAQVGASSSNAVISDQNHSKGDDTKA